jgi:hypothetical protein
MCVRAAATRPVHPRKTHEMLDATERRERTSCLSQQTGVTTSVTRQHTDLANLIPRKAAKAAPASTRSGENGLGGHGQQSTKGCAFQLFQNTIGTYLEGPRTFDTEGYGRTGDSVSLQASRDNFGTVGHTVICFAFVWLSSDGLSRGRRRSTDDRLADVND